MLVSLAFGADDEIKGDFALVTPADQVATIREQAVDAAAKSVTWVFRDVAKSRLAPLATACPAYSMTADATQLIAHCAGEPKRTFTVGYDGDWVNDKGETVHAKVGHTTSVWKVDISTDQGGKRWSYQRKDADHFSLTQEVYSGYLSVPLKYTLDYARVP